MDEPMRSLDVNRWEIQEAFIKIYAAMGNLLIVFLFPPTIFLLETDEKQNKTGQLIEINIEQAVIKSQHSQRFTRKRFN